MPISNVPADQENKLELELPEDLAGKRIDQALAKLLPDYSRSQIQLWIKEGLVLIGGQSCRQTARVEGGERVSITVQERELPKTWQAQEIPLNIVYEDDSILVINKPPGLVVHPGAGNPDTTMLNALLHHVPQLKTVARAGIVHRLDKATSGLLVVAKSEPIRLRLVEALKEHDVQREYFAVINGVPVSGGTIDAPIGRHPKDRKKMTVTNRGKRAVTHYRITERFRAHSLVRVMLETGRTHQIRVHFSHKGMPIVGDPVYGGRLRIPSGCSQELQDALRNFPRQALHASRISLEHPESGEPCTWEVELPKDMEELLSVLRADASQSD